MTTLFSTRTSLGHASAEKRGIGRTVMLALVAVLALIVVTAAVFGAAPALAGAVAAVILLIAAFTIVWANGYGELFRASPHTIRGASRGIDAPG